MNYRLTQHASAAMIKRVIDPAWVNRVMLSPDHVEPDRTDEILEHRLGKIKEFGNRVLRVIVNPTLCPPLIITVYFDRSKRKKS